MCARFHETLLSTEQHCRVARIFVLQDAELKRKKREYLEKAENRTVGKEVDLARILQYEVHQLVF